MKIYTKTGDCGTTGLFAGPRVGKDHPRIQAYGAVDELSAVLGVCVSTFLVERGTATPRAAEVGQTPLAYLDQLADRLRGVQSDLFSIGAELATPDPITHDMCLLKAERVADLERWIDSADEELAPLTNFILPGGSMGSAMLHLARTVCRRAEREVVQLSHMPDVHDCSLVVIYLNRLSDLLFVLARQFNAAMEIPDTPWVRPASS
jgi:cob(I)alamin adenosyltransferase